MSAMLAIEILEMAWRAPMAIIVCRRPSWPRKVNSGDAGNENRRAHGQLSWRNMRPSSRAVVFGRLIVLAIVASNGARNILG